MPSSLYTPLPLHKELSNITCNKPLSEFPFLKIPCIESWFQLLFLIFLHMCLFIAGSCQSTASSSHTSVSVRDEAERIHVPVMKLQLRVFRYRKISYMAIRKM